MTISDPQIKLVNTLGETFLQKHKNGDFSAFKTVLGKSVVNFCITLLFQYIFQPLQTACHQACLAHNRANPNHQYKCNSIVHNRREKVCILGDTPTGCLNPAVVANEDEERYFSRVSQLLSMIFI